MVENAPPPGAGWAPSRPSGLPALGHTVGMARDRFGSVREGRRACGDVLVAEALGLGEICYPTRPAAFERVLEAERAAFPSPSGDDSGRVTTSRETQA